MRPARGVSTTVSLSAGVACVLLVRVAAGQVIPDHVPSTYHPENHEPDTRREFWIPVGVYSSVTWRGQGGIASIGGEISFVNVAHDRRVGIPAYGGVVQVDWDGGLRVAAGGEIVIACLAEGLACVGGEVLVGARGADGVHGVSALAAGGVFVEFVGVLSVGLRVDAPFASVGGGAVYPVGLGLSFTLKAPIGVVKY